MVQKRTLEQPPKWRTACVRIRRVLDLAALPVSPLHFLFASRTSCILSRRKWVRFARQRPGRPHELSVGVIVC